MPPVPTITLAAAATEGAPPNPEAFGIGSLALVLAATAVLGWLAFLYVNSRRRRSAELEEPPENLSPYLSDDELENRRSTIVLRNAVVAGALLSILMVWYAAQEPARQVAFAEAQHEEAVERGAKLYERFGCAGCHGPTGSGGGAEFSEARSGVDVTWYVPSLDDVFYRFSVDEVRFWIEYGRPGTPMPANGLEGGGAMTFQEIDEVIAFLESIQIPRSGAVARREGAVASALQRIDEGDRITAELLAYVYQDCPQGLKVIASMGVNPVADFKQVILGDFPAAIGACGCAPDHASVKALHWAIFGNPRPTSGVTVRLAPPTPAEGDALVVSLPADRPWAEAHAVVVEHGVAEDDESARWLRLELAPESTSKGADPGTRRGRRGPRKTP